MLLTIVTIRINQINFHNHYKPFNSMKSFCAVKKLMFHFVGSISIIEYNLIHEKSVRKI